MSDGPSATPPEDFRSVLASVDRRGRRRWIYAATVAGAWRRRRTVVSTVLILFYAALPFLTIAGEPWLRFDLPRQHIIILGRVFWPQDFFVLLLGVLAAICATLLLVSLFGRVFCGWLCPHNVFLEMVYRRIETWCEGPAHRRAIQDGRTPWPPGLIARKGAKWLLWIAVTGGLANATTALFVGTESFRLGLFIDPAAQPTAATFFAVAFALILFNFAWFREQTCTIVCPYGRLQAALIDRDTLVVAYDAKRGEPRGRKDTTTGDCVDCKACVAVCPTGIDIRNGIQLECINCTACIDACDQVMHRLSRPPGLIRYTSENALEGKPLRLLRPRAAIYAAAMVALATIAIAIVAVRPLLLVTRLRDTAVPLVETDTRGRETVRSLVNLSLVNRDRHPRTVVSALPAELDAELITQFAALRLEPNQRREQTLIVRVPRARFPDQPFTPHRIITRLAVSDDRGGRTEIPLTLEAP